MWYFLENWSYLLKNVECENEKKKQIFLALKSETD